MGFSKRLSGAAYFAALCAAAVLTVAVLGLAHPGASGAANEGLPFRVVAPGLSNDNLTGAKSTLAIDKFGRGDIASSPSGIKCGLECPGGEWSFEAGSMVTVVAHPAAGDRVMWSGCDFATEATCTVASVSNRRILVAFGSGQPTIRQGTYVLDDSVMSNVVRIGPAEIVFRSSAPVVAEIGVGDIIASAVGEGLLRRVTGSSSSGTELTLRTVNAGIDEVFVGGTVLATTTPQSSAASHAASGANVSALGSSSPISVTLSGGGSLTGSISVDPPDVSLAYDASSGLVLRYSQSTRLDATFEANGSLNVTREFTDCGIPPLKLGAITVFAGPVPIVFVPSISFPCKVAASLSAANRVTVSDIHRATFTLKCPSPTTCTASPGYDDIWGYSVAAKRGAVSAKFSVGPEVSLLVYGVAGPYFNLSLYGKAELGIPDVFSGKMSAGVDASAGVKAGLNVPFLKLAAKADFRFANIEVVLASWGAPKIGVAIRGKGSVIGPGINCPSDCVGSGEPDSTVSLTAVESGQQFGRWEGCSSAVGRTCSLKMNSDKTVIAYFTDEGAAPSPPDPPIIEVPLPMSPPQSFPSAIGQ